MSTPQFYAARLASELPAFNRVLRALPGDRLDYRPHEKNTAAGALAWQLAMEMAQLAELFEKGEIHYVPYDTPQTIDEIASAFERNGEAAAAAAKNVSDARWNSQARFYVGEKVGWETSVAEMAWGFLLDMIHHRGQLSAYIRPMGGKVPSIYGPTADERG